MLFAHLVAVQQPPFLANKVWCDQWSLNHSSYCNFVSFIQMTCGFTYSITLAKASCLDGPLNPRMFVSIRTISSRAGNSSKGTGLVLTSFYSLLPLAGGTYAWLRAPFIDLSLDCCPLDWALAFLCGENSAALTLKVVCCFLEVFLDTLPLSLDVSIMITVSSCLLCSTALLIYIYSELVESPRAGTVCSGEVSTFLGISTLSCGDMTTSCSIY